MRLFVAICLEDPIRDALCRASGALREKAQYGRFTDPENLHLTLAFIGETTRLRDAERAVASVQAAPFTLTVGGMGRFARPGGDLYWAALSCAGRLPICRRSLPMRCENRVFLWTASPSGRI
ncbi:MAG: 2'-5' RNA ligase family protein [Oscillospiraceae bacterium]